MKHIFIIGSHTPYLTALGTIQYLQLNKKDIIFIYGRNYKCYCIDNDIEQYDLSDLYYIYLKNRKRNEIHKQIEKIKIFINSTIKIPYTLYIPHLAFYFFQIWAMHPFCKDIKFIQEGITDFCLPNKRFHIPSKKQIFTNLFLLNNTWCWETSKWNDTKKIRDKNITETFAISDKLFSSMSCKHTIIKWPQIKLPIKLDKSATFFVLESLVEQKYIEKEIFMDSCKRMINKYGKEKNYIKFHPYQTKNNCKAILEIFTELGKNVKELPNDIPFEIILAEGNRLKICGFTTSLIYYAALLGHEVHNCTKLLCRSTYFVNHYWKNYSKRLSIYNGIFKYEDNLM